MIHHRRRLISLFILSYLPMLFAQQSQTTFTSLEDSDEKICLKIFDYAGSLNLQNAPIGSVIVKMSKSFIGANYSANTLETSGSEELIINLHVFDCVTLYENALALARCIKKNKMSFDDFKKELQFIRYRNGIINEYPSRLHYTTDYFFDNEKKGVLKDITKEIGGVPYNKIINYMSTHLESYPHLKEKEDFLTKIKLIEEDINSRQIYHIPKNQTQKLSSKIKDGDIFGITTSIEGIDCSHTGIAVWVGKKLHMAHAPAPGKKVEITKLPLSDYLKKNKKSIGIIVTRPLEP